MRIGGLDLESHIRKRNVIVDILYFDSVKALGSSANGDSKFVDKGTDEKE
jgi:hypothetical protein